MTDQSAPAPYLAYDAARARITELRYEAEHSRVARTARRARRTATRPIWPAVVVAALRESLAGGPSRRSTAATADRSRPICCA